MPTKTASVKTDVNGIDVRPEEHSRYDLTNIEKFLTGLEHADTGNFWFGNAEIEIANDGEVKAIATFDPETEEWSVRFPVA